MSVISSDCNNCAYYCQPGDQPRISPGIFENEQDVLMANTLWLTTTKMNPVQECVAVISIPKANAHATLSHAVQERDCCTGMRVRQTRKANAIITGAMTIADKPSRWPGPG